MERPRSRLLRTTIVISLLLPVLLVVVYLANPFDARSLDPRQRIFGHVPYRVASASMTPTFPVGSFVIVRATGAARVAALSRGDVVVFRVPEAGGQHWMMRVVGMPGETVALRDGDLHIDGARVDEPYVLDAAKVTPYSRELSPLTVPAGHLFLLGDNRDNSQDGRMLAPTRHEDVIGRVVAKTTR